MQISRDDLILIHCLHCDNILMVCFGVSARVNIAPGKFLVSLYFLSRHDHLMEWTLLIMTRGMGNTK